MTNIYLCKSLRRKGHVVAIIVDGTNDTHALHEADMRLAKGIVGTEVVKESSGIFILDSSLSSIVKLSYGLTSSWILRSTCTGNRTANIQAYEQARSWMEISYGLTSPWFLRSTCTGHRIATNKLMSGAQLDRKWLLPQKRTQLDLRRIQQRGHL